MSMKVFINEIIDNFHVSDEGKHDAVRQRDAQDIKCTVNTETENCRLVGESELTAANTLETPSVVAFLRLSKDLTHTVSPLLCHHRSGSRFSSFMASSYKQPGAVSNTGMNFVFGHM